MEDPLILMEFMRQCKQGTYGSHYQISGATKLRTWKLRRRISAALPPLASIPRKRRMKAARSSASVTNAMKFQKEKARQVTKRSKVKNYLGSERELWDMICLSHLMNIYVLDEFFCECDICVTYLQGKMTTTSRRELLPTCRGLCGHHPACQEVLEL